MKQGYGRMAHVGLFLALSLSGIAQQPTLTLHETPTASIDLKLDAMNPIAVSASGKQVLVGNKDKSGFPFLVDWATGKTTSLPGAYDFHVYKAALSPDGAFCITQSQENVRYYQLTPKMKLLRTFKTAANVGGFCISPDFRYLAIFSPKDDEGVFVWDLRTMVKKATLKSKHGGDVMFFSSSGDRIGITSSIGPETIEIWQWKGKPSVQKVPLKSSVQARWQAGIESAIYFNSSDEGGITSFYRVNLKDLKVKSLGTLQMNASRILYANDHLAVVTAYTDGGVCNRLGVVTFNDKRILSTRWLATSSDERLEAAVDPTGQFVVVVEPEKRFVRFEL